MRECFLHSNTHTFPHNTSHPFPHNTSHPLTLPPITSYPFTHNLLMITWPRSPLIHRQSPQILSQKPFFLCQNHSTPPAILFSLTFSKRQGKDVGVWGTPCGDSAGTGGESAESARTALSMVHVYVVAVGEMTSTSKFKRHIELTFKHHFSLF